MARRKFDIVGPWTEVKLDIVRDYAREYTKILSKQELIRRFIYIDAFAGAGKHISKQTDEFILGSPANALLIEPPFDEFHFVDLDESRVRLLEQLAENHPNVTVYHGDCNDILLTKIFPRCRYEDYARGLCLLDPYKLCVDWKVLQTAGTMRSVDVFYNFMIMDVNRNYLPKNPDKIRPEKIERMNALWGDESWREVAYKKQPSLFDPIDEKQRNDDIAEAFRKRLRKVAGFQYVPEPIAMKNSTGAVLYYLYFASHKPVAEKIVRHIFRKFGG